MTHIVYIIPQYLTRIRQSALKEISAYTLSCSGLPRSFQALLILLTLWSLSGCNTLKPYYGKEYRNWQEYQLPDSASRLHTVYLIGDGGDMERGAPVIQVLNRMLRAEEDSMSSVVFLGDNIYLHGLPAPDEDDRQEKEEILRAQMDAAAGYTGNVLFIPGNHDWDYSGPDGLARALYQEAFLEEHFENANVFRPDNGCAGPEIISVSDNLILIALNTEWWIHPYEVPRAPENGCLTEDKTDFMIRLASMVRAYDDHHIMIVAHHPVISNGNHGGHYNLLDNIFPLRLVRDNLYIPLPVIGSIYPVARKMGVSPQDIPNTEFQQFKQALLSITEPRANVIYATGHDHNLQLNQEGEMHHIISGSASKLNYAARGFGADYVHQQVGFARVIYYESGDAWVEFFVVNEEDPDGKLSFRKPLYALAEAAETTSGRDLPDYDSIHSATASRWKKRGFPWKLLFGNGRWEEWTTPVSVPVFQPDTVSEARNMLQKSGARNFLTLQARDREGRTVLIRPVEKFSSQTLSGGLRDTWLASEINAQSRAHHPYGDLVIAPLADSLGFPGPQPELVFLPVSPSFGKYMDEFGGILATVEPESEMFPLDSGVESRLLSTRQMIRMIEEDPKTRVDSRLYLKARFLDIISGDWNRSDNDWFWLLRESADEKYIVPVNRDHDQLFPQYDGLLPWLLSRRWNPDPLQIYGDSITDISAYVRPNAVLDQRLLNSLNWHAWDRVVNEFTNELSNETLEAAIRNLPDTIYEATGAEILDKMRTRRNDIHAYARRFYEILTRQMEVTGSHKDDHFELTWIDQGLFRVRVLTDDIEIFDRIFDVRDTEEIRLYGLQGDDTFYIQPGNPVVSVRIIPGRGNDQLHVDSPAEGMPGGKIDLYDAAPATRVSGRAVRVHPDDEFGDFEKDIRNDYSGVTLPVFELGYNPDDGLVTRLGMVFKRPGFRRDPARISGDFDLRYATATGALSTSFRAGMYALFDGHSDLIFSGSFASPYIFNYFGEGNETENIRTIDYYRIPLREAQFSLAFQKRISPRLSFQVFGGYQGYDILQPDADENILSTLPGEEFYNTDQTDFLQAGATLSLKVVDREYNPEKGFYFHGGVGYHREPRGDFGDFLRMHGNLSIYLTPNLPLRTTLATRIGFENNTGDYYFYQSAFLGGLTNLRGHRRTRFAGKSVLYLNNEIRMKLFSFRNDLIAGQSGLIAFYDLGKSWDREGRTGEFSHGYGGGLYVQFLEKFIWRASAGFGEESPYIVVGTGFFF